MTLYISTIITDIVSSLGLIILIILTINFIITITTVIIPSYANTNFIPIFMNHLLFYLMNLLIIVINLLFPLLHFNYLKIVLHSDYLYFNFLLLVPHMIVLCFFHAHSAIVIYFN